MQNDIETSHPLNALEGILLTKSAILRRKMAKNILVEAQIRARKIIKQAQAEAEVLHHQAYTQGYEKGIVSAAEAVVGYIEDYQSLSHQLYQELQLEVKNILSGILHQDEVFLALLDNWLHELRVEDTPQSLHLLLPATMNQGSKELTGLLERIWKGPVVIDYHAERRFVMKYKDQLAEFIPDEFIDSEMPKLLGAKSLRESCGKLSESGLQRLRTVLTRQLDNSPQDLPVNDA
ncbi:Oxygen-regulated invasion protein OrgB [Yersinia nurmii]|uniref:Oxygen-regulated invasion protein OrgB n=1 Tax=Yersinia nurmii TaxID=685706 RepID=A0ABM9S085_9GAMM|nr:hypothetical protein [Yersinia nurmii]CND82932.1 Oxygen-regulated invasion protein OrgB [Yersinia nurmii]